MGDSVTAGSDSSSGAETWNEIRANFARNYKETIFAAAACGECNEAARAIADQSLRIEFLGECRHDESAAMGACPCGIARSDCEYHR